MAKFTEPIEIGDIFRFLMMIISSGIYIIISLIFANYGYKLIIAGKDETWAVALNFEGWMLYVANFLPGFLLVILSTLILIVGLPRALESVRLK